MRKAAVIGKDGRTAALIAGLERSRSVTIPVKILSSGKAASDTAELRKQILELPAAERPDFVVIGPEQPLEAGAVDALRELGIAAIGPTKTLARLESSKSFTRSLVSKYKIPGNPDYQIFEDLKGARDYLEHLERLGGFVIKPDGLTGGKGVMVSGSHLFSVEEGAGYCERLLAEGGKVIIEEKLDGEEFSLQSFCDGKHVADMVVVQDHKRAYEGDLGPNTGGMGSYSCEDHLLPFLSSDHLAQASQINQAVAEALNRETGEEYKGILYGGFMATRQGVRLVEYNARFGDPEALNVLSLLTTDFADICQAIIDGTLDRLPVHFNSLATVCKYVVPEGYPENPASGELLDLTGLPPESENLRIYRAAIDETQTGSGIYRMSGSRAVAFVGIGGNLEEAEAIAENAARSVKGRVRHRQDIGTRELLSQKVLHMRNLLAPSEPN